MFTTLKIKSETFYSGIDSNVWAVASSMIEFEILTQGWQREMQQIRAPFSTGIWRVVRLNVWRHIKIQLQRKD